MEALDRIADDAAAIIVALVMEWISLRMAGRDGQEKLHANVRTIVRQALDEAAGLPS